jgi:hypothetical protein
MDEKLISVLLTGWREKVWHYTEQFLGTIDADDQARLRLELEEAIRIGHIVSLGENI